MIRLEIVEKSDGDTRNFTPIRFCTTLHCHSAQYGIVVRDGVVAKSLRRRAGETRRYALAS